MESEKKSNTGHFIVAGGETRKVLDETIYLT